MDKKTSATLMLAIVVLVASLAIVAHTINSNNTTPSTDPTPTLTTYKPPAAVIYYFEKSTEPQYNTSSRTPDSYLTRWNITINIVGGEFPVNVSLWDFCIDYITTGEYVEYRNDGSRRLVNGSNTVLAWNLNYLSTSSDGHPEYKTYQNITVDSGNPFSYTLRFVSRNQTNVDSIVSSIFRYCGSENLTLIKSRDLI